MKPQRLIINRHHHHIIKKLMIISSLQSMSGPSIKMTGTQNDQDHNTSP